MIAEWMMHRMGWDRALVEDHEHALDVMRKATESDGTLEELAGVLVQDADIEHERARTAEGERDSHLAGLVSCRRALVERTAERDAARVCLRDTDAAKDLALTERDAARAEVEQRRLRAARAVELLRAAFTLRPDCGMVDDAAEDARAEVKRLRGALLKIDAIRNSIVGCQTVNFSEHVYPLVAALEEAGFSGVGYDAARKNVGTLIERTTRAEAEVERLRSERDLALGQPAARREASGTTEPTRALRSSEEHRFKLVHDLVTVTDELDAIRDALRHVGACWVRYDRTTESVDEWAAAKIAWNKAIDDVKHLLAKSGTTRGQRLEGALRKMLAAEEHYFHQTTETGSEAALDEIAQANAQGWHELGQVPPGHARWRENQAKVENQSARVPR